MTAFRIQYETYLDGRWHVVLRYDTAHGFPHCDTLHPDGREDKAEFPDASHDDVLTMGEQEIKSNWRKHRERYVREM